MTTWSQDAAVALHTLNDGLEAASRRIVDASAEEWVSPAGKAYDALLERHHDALAALLTVCSDGARAVLEHTNAADDCTRAESHCL